MPTELIDRLKNESHRFEFEAAVRVLERAGEGWKPLAGLHGIGRERVRLRVSPSMNSQGAPIEKKKNDEAQEENENVRLDSSISGRHVLVTRLSGLCGTASPLPRYMVHEILLDSRSESLADSRKPLRTGRLLGFVDVFNHRILSLRYRAATKYRWDLNFDPSSPSGFTPRMKSLLGIRQGTRFFFPDNEPTSETGAEVPLWVARHFLSRVKSAWGLLDFLKASFPRNPLSVTQCVARRVPIPAESLLSFKRHSPTRLGSRACIGKRIYDRSTAFRIHVGPMPFEDFILWLPSCKDTQLKKLHDRVDAFLDSPHEYDVELILDKQEGSKLRAYLGNRQRRLGEGTGIFERPRDHIRVTIPYSAISQTVGQERTT